MRKLTLDVVAYGAAGSFACSRSLVGVLKATDEAEKDADAIIV